MVDPPDLRLYLTALGRQLRQVRKAQRLGTEALAARTGMAAQNVRAIEAGQRNVTMGTLLRFAEALNVPMLALLPEESHEVAGPAPLVDLQRLGWHVALVPSPPAGRGWLPALDAAAQAGPVASWRDAEVLGWLQPPSQRLGLIEGLFALRVSGDTMAPRIADGAWCLCRSPAMPPLIGKVLVFQHGPGTAGWQLKRLAGMEAVEDGDGLMLKLASWNPAYPPQHLSVRGEGELMALAELLEVLG